MGQHWETSPEYKGRTVAICAGGPSLSLAQIRLLGVARAADLVRVIAVNDAVYPVWFADILYACDGKWWRYHNGVPGFAGIKVSMSDSGFDDVRFVHQGEKLGFSETPGTLSTGGNSGYQALHLAAHLGAARVLLVGFDMSTPAQHWFGDHPGPLTTKISDPSARIQRFNDLAEILKGKGFDVRNCSTQTTLGCFPKADLAAELRALGVRA